MENKKEGLYLVGTLFEGDFFPCLDSVEIMGHALDQLSKLYWTTEPPTQEGWYWVRDVDGSTKIAKKTPYGWYLCGIEVEFYPYEAREYFTHWLGPLPIPEPPKGE